MGHLTREQKTELRDAFDADYYLDSNPDVGNVDPFEHFMRHGWTEGRNPAPNFSTSYYKEWAPDLGPDTNPFIHWITHGRRENRTTLPFRDRLDRIEYNPKVSVVVPNFNHERFLEQRIDSILAQTYDNLEVLILDDCSTDDSRSIIEKYCKEFPDRVRSLLNEENSGKVFRQWRKGVTNTDGELVWICESDDFCEPDFLENLVPHFRDRSVNLAFGRIQFSNEAGDLQRGLDGYREGAESGIWREQLIRPAGQWFTNGFGVNNVIANVGGCIWRRHDLPPEVWEEAEGYTVVGDWFLYAHIAGGGQIAWDPEAVAYFRQHHANTSVNAFTTPPYYEEHQRFMLFLRRQWGVPNETVERFYEKVSGQYEHFEVEKEYGPLESHLSKSKLLAPAPTQPHILLAFLGFHPGGGENFPIHLANELHHRGNLVSMMALDMSEVNTQMLETLDSGVPVYDSRWVAEYGADRFLADAGVSIIHSHMVSLEWFFFEKTRIETEIPYLVSLHGSYQVSALADDLMERIVGSVSHWVYTAEKNLDPFQDLDLPSSRFTMLGNAMPNDPSPYPQTRGDLGIDDDAIVFTLVARGIKRKGWRAAINAFKELRDSHPERSIHLLLCGEGTETDRHLAIDDTDPDITFLGYQSRIHGLYRLSDVALVPTRFGGESYPLCIIQALQARTPVISTDAGEIRSMVTPPDAQPGGILVDVVRDTDEFTNRVRDAMSEMLRDDYRRAFVAAAEKLGTRYDMGKIAQDYETVYEGLIGHTQ
ncbi:MAG: glycosyltransferase, partial [Acidimicrobiia bacterium]|nr:glycosyltransferase [Acidimicrobiia bacterium]